MTSERTAQALIAGYMKHLWSAEGDWAAIGLVDALDAAGFAIVRKPTGDTERNEVIRQLAQVLAGLEVPMSLGLPLGAAREPWTALHGRVGFGYLSESSYEAMLRKALAAAAAADGRTPDKPDEGGQR